MAEKARQSLVLTLAVTTGDPAGIGPEVALKAARAVLADRNDVIVHLYGDPILFAEGHKPSARLIFKALTCAVPPKPGSPDVHNGPYVIDLIKTAVAQVHSGQADALITAPIAKSVLYETGFAFPGHTEFLGHLAGGRETHMMLAAPGLRVVPVTLHQSLRSAVQGLSIARIKAAAQAADQALRSWFGLPTPRLVVCGLNPHAGEGGALGTEDEDIVRPAVAALRAEGLAIEGPLPADTLFHAAARARYDCALGLYHDQVLIPIKALAFDQAVNLTLGLPFVRTSPDHGTAFDIAGQGKANFKSMRAAIDLALDLIS